MEVLAGFHAGTKVIVVLDQDEGEEEGEDQDDAPVSPYRRRRAVEEEEEEEAEGRGHLAILAGFRAGSGLRAGGEAGRRGRRGVGVQQEQIAIAEL